MEKENIHNWLLSFQLRQYLNVNARYKIKDRINPKITPAEADIINVFHLTGKNFMHVTKIKPTPPRLQETVPSECHCGHKALSPRTFPIRLL